MPPLLVALWSSTGGSGTSVFTAACALTLARQVRAGDVSGVRVVDLAGDLPAVLGLAADPDVGVSDWLAAGVEAPTDALDRLLIDIVPGVTLLPCGRGPDSATGLPTAESGAAMAVALGHAPSAVFVDCGTAREPAARAVVEVADVAVLVLRECYLALRRAVRAPSLSHTTGIVLVEEPGRSLNARDVGDVLDLPVLAHVPVKDAISRAVDAGVLPSRVPDALARSASDLLRRAGVAPGRRGEAA